MGEEVLMATAAEEAAKAATEAAVTSAAEAAVGEAVKLTWKEGVMLGLSGIGAATVAAGITFGLVKLTKHISKKIKAKKGVPVAEEVPNNAEESVEVEGFAPETEEN